MTTHQTLRLYLIPVVLIVVAVLVVPGRSGEPNNFIPGNVQP